MRQSDKIIYSLTSTLTDEERRNIFYYFTNNKSLDKEVLSNLLEKFDLTTYEFNIIELYHYNNLETQNLISLIRARKYINKSHEDSSSYCSSDLFRGWLLYISSDKNYFYDCEWNETEQNNILDFFKVKYENAPYRDNDLTKMFSVYYVKETYKRNISDYNRFLPLANSISIYLTKTKESYDKLKMWLYRFTMDLYNKPYGQTMYNIIDSYNNYIDNIVNAISYGWYTSEVDVHIDIETQKLILNINFIKTDKVDYGFVDIDRQLQPLFELIKEDIEYFNTYGHFFNIEQ